MDRDTLSKALAEASGSVDHRIQDLTTFINSEAQKQRQLEVRSGPVFGARWSMLTRPTLCPRYSSLQDTVKRELLEDKNQRDSNVHRLDSQLAGLERQLQLTTQREQTRTGGRWLWRSGTVAKGGWGPWEVGRTCRRCNSLPCPLSFF